jgi:hypothetical protein
MFRQGTRQTRERDGAISSKGQNCGPHEAEKRGEYWDPSLPRNVSILIDKAWVVVLAEARVAIRYASCIAEC